MKLGQLIEYTKRNIFFKNNAENKNMRLVPDLFLECGLVLVFPLHFVYGFSKKVFLMSK